MVAPKAVSAAERILASGSSASFSRTAVDGLDVPPSDEIDQHQPAVARCRLQPCGQQVVDFLGGKIGQDVSAAAVETSALASSAGVQEHGSAGSVARRLQPADRSDPHLAGAGLGGLQQGIAGLGIGTIGQGQEQEGLPRRRRLAQLGHSRPPSSSRLPNASAYAVTTHCRSTVAKCSDRCADGSATFTIVRSRTIMSWAIATVARTRQRLRVHCMFSVA